VEIIKAGECVVKDGQGVVAGFIRGNEKWDTQKRMEGISLTVICTI
jgi:hypothetical protein